MSKRYHLILVETASGSDEFDLIVATVKQRAPSFTEAVAIAAQRWEREGRMSPTREIRFFSAPQPEPDTQ